MRYQWCMDSGMKTGIVLIAGDTLHFGRCPLVTTKAAIALTVVRRCRRWNDMTKQDAATLLVQLYADYSVLCAKYGDYLGDCTAEAVAMAVQALQGVE